MLWNKITILTLQFLVGVLFSTVTGNENEDNEPTSKFISVASHPKAELVNISIATCRNLPFELHGDVSTVNTRNSCARFWDGWNCTGHSIEILARSPSHGDLTPWGFNDRTASVGPCRNPCDFEVTGKQPDAPFEITMYTNKNFKRFADDDYPPANLTVSGCTVIPLEYQETNLKSVRTFGHCVQIWSNPDCVMRDNSTDDTVELRWGTPMHGNLWDGWWMRSAMAVSHCRYKCNDTTEEIVNASKFNGGPREETVKLNTTIYHKDSKNESTSNGWVWFLLVLLVLGFVGVGYIAYQRYRSGERLLPIPRRRLDNDF